MGDITDSLLQQDDVEPLYDLGGTLFCRHCKVPDLHWVLDERTGKHRLANPAGKIHTCEQYTRP